MRTVFLSISRR